MTAQIDDLIDQAVAQAQAEDAAAHEAEQAKRREERQRVVDNLKAQLSTELGLELFGALSLKAQLCEHSRLGVSVVAQIDGAAIEIIPRPTYSYGGDDDYVLRCPYIDPHHIELAGLGHLRSALLLYLGKVRTQIRAKQEREKQAEEERARYNAQRLKQREEWRAQQAREQEKEREARAALEDELQRGQASAAREAEENRAAVRARLWQWPAGATVTFFQVIWCRGASYDSDGEIHAEYDEGWTLQHDLDDDGKITLQPNARSTKVRVLYLSDDAHKPVFEACTYAGVDELPRELQVCIDAQIPIVEIDEYRREVVRSIVPEHIGVEPCAWIKELLAAATKGA